jgi:hypothetical protein
MLRLPSIFAFGFAHLAMLGWLAAAAVPILIHLWSRRRYREMTWAAMEYLLAAIRRHRRRLQLEQLLLLLVRTLVIVLVVLAVAEPYFERLGLAFVAGERTHRVLVVDGSYSMAYTPTDKSCFERAKELAIRMVEESPQGDGFTLVLMSAPPRVVVRNPVFAARDFLPEIDRLRLPHTTADLPATLARVEEILVAARREHPRVNREEVYFLTDLGRVGWLVDPADAAARDEFLQRSKRLAERAALVVIDLGQDGAENLAVTSLDTTEPFAVAGRAIHVQAEVKNFGRQAQGRQLVELLADGRRVRQQHVDLPAAGEASVGFSHRFESPGDHTLEVRLVGDRLDVDNHRWVALPVKPFLHVLCVDGRPSGEPFGGATGYLSLALSAEADPADKTLIRPEVVPFGKLLESQLERYDAVFLCNVAQFTSSEAQALDAYLRGGGSLVFFLGDQVMPDRYNAELGGGSGRGVRLLPARLGPLVSEPQFRLDPLDYGHPIVRSFQDHERAGLLTTPVEKYIRLTVPKRSKAKMALALANGDPLVVEEPVHRGRVVLFATSADDSWTLMPKWLSYLPIVRDALFFAIGDQLGQRNVEVGQAIGAPVPADAADLPLVVQAPDGRREEAGLHTEESPNTWSYSETGTSGIYTAQFGPPAGRAEAFAVNVDPVESDLARITPDELGNVVWPEIPFICQTSWQNLADEPVGPIYRSSRLPKILLYAVLGLLFVETFLAWRFGHHSQ